MDLAQQPARSRQIAQQRCAIFVEYAAYNYSRGHGRTHFQNSLKITNTTLDLFQEGTACFSIAGKRSPCIGNKPQSFAQFCMFPVWHRERLPDGIDIAGLAIWCCEMCDDRVKAWSFVEGFRFLKIFLFGTSQKIRLQPQKVSFTGHILSAKCSVAPMREGMFRL